VLNIHGQADEERDKGSLRRVDATVEQRCGALQHAQQRVQTCARRAHQLVQQQPIGGPQNLLRRWQVCVHGTLLVRLALQQGRLAGGYVDDGRLPPGLHPWTYVKDRRVQKILWWE
jgi:hypothetical protein